MKENVIYVSLRLYMNQPEHVRINKVLQNLNPMVCKSKNQFIVNALGYYIDHLDGVSMTLEKEENDPVLRRSDLKEFEKEIAYQATEAARNETVKMLSGIFAGLYGAAKDKGGSTHQEEEET